MNMATQENEMGKRSRWTAVVLLFILSAGVTSVLSACKKDGAKVTVTEVEKGRTHVFSLVSDGQMMRLDGKLSIDAKLYPGTLLYDGRESIIMRDDPDQCIAFADPAKVLFGFIPVTGLDMTSGDASNPAGVNVTVLRKDAAGRAVKYQVENVVHGTMETSIVEIDGIEHAQVGTAAGTVKSALFVRPAGCIRDEEAFTIG